MPRGWQHRLKVVMLSVETSATWSPSLSVPVRLTGSTLRTRFISRKALQHRRISGWSYNQSNLRPSTSLFYFPSLKKAKQLGPSGMKNISGCDMKPLFWGVCFIWYLRNESLYRGDATNCVWSFLFSQLSHATTQSNVNVSRHCIASAKREEPFEQPAKQRRTAVECAICTSWRVHFPMENKQGWLQRLLCAPWTPPRELTHQLLRPWAA